MDRKSKGSVSYIPSDCRHKYLKIGKKRVCCKCGFIVWSKEVQQ